ncbi:hypothetical protein CDO73_11090 [Saccharibacillus sp. O23]|nr:hypothetical protein CDO73_11090 [Saccharibacillus sp. O23]
MLFSDSFIEELARVESENKGDRFASSLRLRPLRGHTPAPAGGEEESAGPVREEHASAEGEEEVQVQYA